MLKKGVYPARRAFLDTFYAIEVEKYADIETRLRMKETKVRKWSFLGKILTILIKIQNFWIMFLKIFLVWTPIFNFFLTLASDRYTIYFDI